MRGSGGILPQIILKSRVSEMVFSVLSMRYFFKKNTLDKCKLPGTFCYYSNILIGSFVSLIHIFQPPSLNILTWVFTQAPMCVGRKCIMKHVKTKNF